MKEKRSNNKEQPRRNFLKGTLLASGGALLYPGSKSRLFGASDKIRLAIIGCGNRGVKDLWESLNADPNVELIAAADMFQDKVDNMMKNLNKKVSDKSKIKLKPETVFLGFDAYKKVLDMKEVDMVLLTTPPGFRPMMVKAAVEAGKHIFIEKPGGVDPAGIRSLIKSGEAAVNKRLSVAACFQQRWMPQYKELKARIDDGQLGQITSVNAYWISTFVKWHWSKRKSKWSDMEWQIRCWPYFVWLSGDHFVEQLVHNIDIMNWYMGSVPVKCMGTGGRAIRSGTGFGNIYDHFSVEYEYPNGIRNMAIAVQQPKISRRVGNYVAGTKGYGEVNRATYKIEGKTPYKFDKKAIPAEKLLFQALYESIRKSRPMNDIKIVAEATMTAIMGRMSAYTGRQVSWKWVMNASQLNLFPEKLEMGKLPVRPVAKPGITKLI